MKTHVALIFALTASPALAGTGSVAGSKHDFSASGPGPVRAVSEQSACAFCHASHAAGPESLSSRPDARAARPYESSTLTSRASAPGGSSRLCLSCHDGTIAVGQTRNRAIPMSQGQAPIAPGKRGYLGTDLRTSHPVGIRTAQDGRTSAPKPGDRVRVDGRGEVQCTSCHDPHAEWGDPVAGKFLVKPASGSALCTSCHAPGLGKGAPSASHALADASASGGGTGCGACHVAHGADPSRGQLMRADRRDDDLCLGCHGDGASKAVASQYRRPFGHGVPTPGRHDAAEGKHAPAGKRLPETSAGAARHVACVDCHEPHASSAVPSIAPLAGGALAGVWGIDLQGEQVTPARFEYEVCFKCHADSANKPQDGPMRAAGTARRANDDFNLRRVFAGDAVSAHPVATAGRGTAPSLDPSAASGFVLCSDCHSSDEASAGTAAAPRGPHGSSYRFILERQYLTSDRTPESPEAYALCYKCHVRDTLLSNQSSFPLHRRHVVDQSAPCSACHDAHGISADAGTERNNAHLLAFDLEIVRAGTAGPPIYETAVPGRGSCNLTCHGVVHAQGNRAFSY